MKTLPTSLDGAFIVDLDRHEDARGYFGRLFCVELFKELGLPAKVEQMNRSMTAKKHTLRGLHYQLPPHQESKTIICTKGAIFDVFIDLRPDSSTFLQHHSVSITAEEPRLIHVPKGFAHGFQSLADNTEIIYIVDEAYNGKSERGILWNDPKFNIAWPAKPSQISERDMSHPQFSLPHHLPHADQS